MKKVTVKKQNKKVLKQLPKKQMKQVKGGSWPIDHPAGYSSSVTEDEMPG